MLEMRNQQVVLAARPEGNMQLEHFRLDEVEMPVPSGRDAVADHKALEFAEQLARACPDGIDVYFELVGGPIWDTVLPLLNTYARVPVCGLISQYELSSDGFEGRDCLPGTMAQIMGRSLTLRGFIQSEFVDEQLSGFLQEAGPWVSQGKLRYREHVLQGLETAPSALMRLMKGQNLGKMLVQVGEP